MPIEVVCERCNKTFYRKPSQTDTFTGKNMGRNKNKNLN